MSNTPIPEEPKIITVIGQFQKVVAGISVTVCVVVWGTGFEFFANLFKPDYVGVLTGFRMGLALVAAVMISFVGYHQFNRMIQWLFKGYEDYKKLMAIKKEIEETNTNKTTDS